MKLAPPSAFKIRTGHLEDLGSSKLNYDNMEFQRKLPKRVCIIAVKPHVFLLLTNEGGRSCLRP